MLKDVLNLNLIQPKNLVVRNSGQA